MLAQNFLTPAKLDIPEDLHEALVGVLGDLERGELAHVVVPLNEVHLWEATHNAPTGFSMAWWSRKTFPGCGTPACIGGWCEHRLGRKFQFSHNHALYCLLYPNNEHPPEPYDYEAITLEQAARALRSYLTRGAPCWAEVLSDD